MIYSPSLLGHIWQLLPDGWDESNSAEGILAQKSPIQPKSWRRRNAIRPCIVIINKGFSLAHRRFVMTGFGSYCDEFCSPKDPNKHFMGIAGLLAWSDDWVALTDRWLEIQKKENVPTFHTVDFVHHNEDFSDKRWESPDERKRILGLFLGALDQAHVIPVSAAVSLKDFNGLTEVQRKKL